MTQHREVDKNIISKCIEILQKETGASPRVIYSKKYTEGMEILFSVAKSHGELILAALSLVFRLSDKEETTKYKLLAEASIEVDEPVSPPSLECIAALILITDAIKGIKNGYAVAAMNILNFLLNYRENKEDYEKYRQENIQKAASILADQAYMATRKYAALRGIVSLHTN